MAPSGMTFVDDPDHPWHGDLFLTGLRGHHLQRIQIAPEGPREEIFYVREQRSVLHGQLRDVEYHDGALWVLVDRGGVIRLTPA